RPHLLLGDPLRVRRRQRWPYRAANAFDLAALHRQPDRVYAGIAAHDLDLGADDLVERVRRGQVAGAGRADDRLPLEQVLAGRDFAGVPDKAGRWILRAAAAEPGEVLRLVFARDAKQRREGNSPGNMQDFRTVAGRCIEEIIGRLDAA